MGKTRSFHDTQRTVIIDSGRERREHEERHRSSIGGNPSLCPNGLESIDNAVSQLIQIARRTYEKAKENMIAPGSVLEVRATSYRDERTGEWKEIPEEYGTLPLYRITSGGLLSGNAGKGDERSVYHEEWFADDWTRMHYGELREEEPECLGDLVPQEGPIDSNDFIYFNVRIEVANHAPKDKKDELAEEYSKKISMLADAKILATPAEETPAYEHQPAEAAQGGDDEGTAFLESIRAEAGDVITERCVSGIFDGWGNNGAAKPKTRNAEDARRILTGNVGGG